MRALNTAWVGTYEHAPALTLLPTTPLPSLASLPSLGLAPTSGVRTRDHRAHPPDRDAAPAPALTPLPHRPFRLQVCIRLANATATNKNETVTLEERFEIVSLTGTLSRHGCHLHISIADFQGRATGIHLATSSTALPVLVHSLLCRATLRVR